MIKNTFKLLMISLIAGSFVACSSGVSMADVQKQESKAKSELKSAQDEMLELAKMKEEYSVDNRDAQIKALETRQKQMKKDVKNLNSVGSASAEGAAGDMAKNLEKESSKIDKEISDLKNRNKENWEQARTAINDRVASLEQQITEITSNLSEDDQPVSEN